MTTTPPACRTCGFTAEQCAQIRARHGSDHDYSPTPPPPPVEVRPSRRTPAAWHRT